MPAPVPHAAPPPRSAPMVRAQPASQSRPGRPGPPGPAGLSIRQIHPRPGASAPAVSSGSILVLPRLACLAPTACKPPVAGPSRHRGPSPAAFSLRARPHTVSTRRQPAPAGPAGFLIRASRAQGPGAGLRVQLACVRAWPASRPQALSRLHDSDRPAASVPAPVRLRPSRLHGPGPAGGSARLLSGSLRHAGDGTVAPAPRTACPKARILAGPLRPLSPYPARSALPNGQAVFGIRA